MIGQGEEGEENLIEKSLSKITLKIVKPRTVMFKIVDVSAWHYKRKYDTHINTSYEKV